MCWISLDRNHTVGAVHAGVVWQIMWKQSYFSAPFAIYTSAAVFNAAVRLMFSARRSELLRQFHWLKVPDESSFVCVFWPTATFTAVRHHVCLKLFASHLVLLLLVRNRCLLQSTNVYVLHLHGRCEYNE